MQSGFEQQAGEEAPLYVRWNPERSPYALELRLDLVSGISHELGRADNLSMEIGGVLIGFLPSANSPALRIDEMEMVPRGIEEGTNYVLNPGQHDRIADIQRRAKARGREAVGFFRSHLRPGAMRPSLADRSLLSAEFNNTLYAVLFIEGRQPHNATFFLGVGGHLPAEPSVRSFRFDEREFRALPEVKGEPARPEAVPEEPTAAGKRSGYGPKVYGTIAALLAIAVVACGLMWFFSGQTQLPKLITSKPANSNPIGLQVTDRGNLLRISWDREDRGVDRASGATLLIVDGSSRREVRLGVDELRLGAVDYERGSTRVQVMMTLNTAGSDAANRPAPQTVYWWRP